VKEGPVVEEQVGGQGKLAQRGPVISRRSRRRRGRTLTLRKQGVSFI